MDKSTVERVSEKERQYVSEVLDTDFRSSQGSIMTSRLEKAFAEKWGMKFGISFINGTSTLHAAIEAKNIGIGDEVIVPPLTMSSTSFAVLQANAVPIFADVDRDTFEISAESIAQRITDKTKAIETVSLYGLSPDMDPIMDLCKEHNLTLIEDNAQCFLGKYKENLVGTFGDCASFSFQSSKHITSGEGGMIITNDEEYANNIRRFQSLGYASVGASKGKITRKDIQDPVYERHCCLGWNYRMPELCAAVALAQLERIDELVQRRIDVAQEFSKIAEGCNWLIPQKTPDDCENSYWTWVVKLETDKFSWYEFRDKFLENGGDGIYAAWKLSYQEPVFQNKAFWGRESLVKDQIQSYDSGLCENAEYLQPRLLQFKTNYWDWSKAETNFAALQNSIDFFNAY